MTGFLLAPARAVAEKSDFFTFFHLVVSPELSDLKQKVLVFKPSGPAFQKFVTVKLHMGKQEEVQSLQLLLARTFVNDGQKGIFAADISKSFLRGAFSESDPDIEQLADDIEFRVRSTSPVLTAGPNRGAHTLTRPPTAAYDVFLGRARRGEILVPRCKLSLENVLIEGEEVLLISASAV